MSKSLSSPSEEVPVVMPERRAEDYPSPRTRDAYNAALDEVLLKLLERICEPQADHERLKIGRLAAGIELRALLGKE